MDFNKNDFSYVLCPGSMPDADFSKTYTDIYKCWRATWTDAFNQLNIETPLYSDAFTRQDYVGALFHKQTCFALAFYRWMDARREEFPKDSYFSNWSSEHQRVLCSRGPKIIVCSNFTVHHVGRKDSLGVSGKDLLMGMIVQTFMNSHADAMTGAVRVDRGVNSAGTRWGAYVIDEKVPCDYGEKNTDLIGFFKDHINLQPQHPLQPLVEDIWNRRVVLTRQRIGEEFSIPKQNKKIA